MKLLTKTSLIYLLATVFVFLAGGLVFYYNLRSIIDEETTEKLEVQKIHFRNFVAQYDSLPALSYEHNGLEHIIEIASPVKENICDTSFFSKEEDEQVPYRMLEFPVAHHGKNYSVTIAKPLFESEDLVETILTSFAIIAAVLLIVTLTVNGIVSRIIWKPFLKTVQQLNQYRIGQQDKPDFMPTSTREFRELNEAIGRMTEKVNADYNSLKAFTENASHELQTPLSVILNTSELLLQRENLDEKQAEQVQRIHGAAKKLSRLNQTLLLLAKINNRQFLPAEKTDFAAIIDNRLALFAEIAEHKNIRIEKEIKAHFRFDIHPALAESLISNLISNAIRHSEPGSDIRIQCDEKRISISNPGSPLQHPERIFERFYKENPSSESTGLGLALVRQIAESSGLKISYSFTENRHCFEVQI